MYLRSLTIFNDICRLLTKKKIVKNWGNTNCEHGFHQEGAVFSPPPPLLGGDFLLTPCESGCFLFPLSWFSGVDFSPNL
jgi:hypothetical protein